MLLGATFFDLLPESIQAAQSQGWSVRAMFVVLVVGFLGFYVTERVLILHSCAEDDCTNEAHHRLGRMSVMGLIAHSTLDGAAIGAASLVNLSVGIMVALAIVAHDLSDGLNTDAVGYSGRKGPPGRISYSSEWTRSLQWSGALLALQFLPSPKWLAVFLALASGFFLYTATSDLLPEAHKRSPSPSVTILTIVGVSIMAVAVGLTRLDYGALQRYISSMF